MLDDFTPGQNIRLTVSKAPKRTDATQTIERLMRQNPETARDLKAASRYRKRTMKHHIWGGRRKAQQTRATKLVHVETGASWTMRYTPLLANDIKSVSGYLTAESA